MGRSGDVGEEVAGRGRQTVTPAVPGPVPGEAGSAGPTVFRVPGAPSGRRLSWTGPAPRQTGR